MGAEGFRTVACGDSAEDAFTQAVEDARYQYGNNGYTGTIAEKDEFVIFELPSKIEVELLESWLDGFEFNPGQVPSEHRDFVEKVFPVYDDKWGPAVAIRLEGENIEEVGVGTGSQVWLFTGWASC